MLRKKLSNIIIFGAGGAIGSAFINQLNILYPEAEIHLFSTKKMNFDYKKINSYQLKSYSDCELEHYSMIIKKSCASIDLIINAIGILHYDNIMPEKSLREISAENLQYIYNVNVIIPTLIIKHFAQYLNNKETSIFATLSARVGSISDNFLGGWYSYRASKAALNMIIKNSSIEISRKNKKAIICGLHPGTVDSLLSKPFQRNIASNTLFTPDNSVQKMIEVIKKLNYDNSGMIFAWDGQEINP